MKNDRLRWSFFKWRIDVENDVASFWKTNNSNFSFQNRFRELSFLSHSKKRRETCVCVLCSKEIRIKSVVCEKDLSSIEFKDFCFLKSILELIVNSLVNIKRKKKKSISLTKFKYFLFYFIFQTIFYSILF